MNRNYDARGATPVSNFAGPVVNRRANCQLAPAPGQSVLDLFGSAPLEAAYCPPPLVCGDATDGVVIPVGPPASFNCRSRSSTVTPLVIQASAGAPFK